MDIPAPPQGWTARLVDQLQFHWTLHIRPRLDGLTDDEYFWVIHHSAEILVLRDLYAQQRSLATGP